MASTYGAAKVRGRVIEPWTLLGLFLAGIATVRALPGVAPHLPHTGRPEEAQYAATCLGVFVVTGGYVYLAARRRSSLGRAWLLWTLGYNAGLVIVKFILSPTAFEKSSGTSLGAFLTAGVLVVPLYLGGLALLYLVAARRTGGWSWSSKIGIAAGLATAAVIARLLTAAALGRASSYLDDLFFGSGLVLPAVVAAASLAVMESFSRSGEALRTAFSIGCTLVVVEHALWLVYMHRLFG